MAEEKDNKDAKPKAVDYFEKRRNFNPANAKELFGEKWVEAMNAVSKAGGYGVVVTEGHEKLWDDGIFGGFAIPQGDKHAAKRAKINAALNGLK